MPRLSIIIPYQNDDTTLESTILSVLENRPEDSEVIVVHDGSYPDPYQLGDEVLLIEDASSSPTAQVNAGLMVARAPVVCVLSNGALILGEGWAEGPCRRLMETDEIATLAVSVGSSSCDSATRGIGLEATSEVYWLQAGLVEQSHSGCFSGPVMSCGFYRRKVLLAIGGWNERIAWDNADIELALLMSRMGLRCELHEDESVVATASRKRLSTLSSVKELADLAVTYGLSGAGLPTAVLHLLKGALNGRMLRSVAWSAGLLRPKGIADFSDRLKSAELGLHRMRQQAETKATSLSSLRRAA